MGVASKLRVMLVFGTRPEAIKMAPLVQALRRDSSFHVQVVATGQHRQMLQQVFEVFNLKPDVDLQLMQPGQSLPGLTEAVLRGMTERLREFAPDLLLVHGDTTTAFASALAAFYQDRAVGHVEAGLRSFDMRRPWPEEFNRVSIDRVSACHFAPSETARRNLLDERHAPETIFLTGNTGIDALLQTQRYIQCETRIRSMLDSRYAHLDPSRRLILVTGHRRESFGEGFARICDGLAELARRQDVEILYPIHLNPQVRETVSRRLAGVSRIRLVEPVDYLDMVYLMDRAFLLLTDSGGLQEEGPALGRPVLVMRDVTERPEALETGVVSLVGTNPRTIVDEASRLLDDEASYRARARAAFPYGQGDAAVRIVAAITERLAR